MTNNVFVDSSLLIEYIKDSKTKLLNTLLSQNSIQAYINETVVSEFLLYFIAINGNASPRSLHSSAKIPYLFQTFNSYDLLKRFSFIANDENLFYIVPGYMEKYNLLPNDAIILATCKIHNITKLASHDTDFIIPCKEEGIELLREG